MKIIDGKSFALEIQESLKKEIKDLNIVPGLAIIYVGDNPASEIYIKNKIKVAEEIGIKTEVFRFTSEVSENDIIVKIKELNEDSNVDGIIIQSPLPKIFNEDYINSFIDKDKDVDGFGIYNLGALASFDEKFIAATPYGVIKLLEHENIELKGANVVVVGRSKIVGRPLALALLNRDATVTIAHSKTKDLKAITSMADILVVAIGSPKFITADYVKEGAVVIDVGISRVDGQILGDVDFDSVKEKVSYITPVPGGVGPMTIAMLLNNVVESAKKRGR